MVTMRAALVIAGNDLRRRLRDRSALLMGVVAPVLMAVIIGTALGGGLRFDATVGVVDADGSDLTGQIARGLVEDTPDDAPLRFTPVPDVEVAKEALQGRPPEGSPSLDAVLVLPAGFGASLGGPEPGTLEVIVDADKPISGDVSVGVANGVAAQLDAGRLAILTVAELDPGAVSDAVRAAGAVRLPIEIDQQDVAGTYSPVAYFAPSMAILVLVLTMGAGARSIVTERKEGTLDRVRAAPVGDRAVLLGKSLAVFGLGIVSMTTVWAVTSVAFRADWGAPGAVAAVIVAVVFSIAGISLLLCGLARTEQQADGWQSMVAFGLALLGGNFISPGNLPPLLQTVSRFTPNGQALQALFEVGAGGARVGDIVGHLVVLVAVGLVTGGLGLTFLGRRLQG